MDGVVVVPGESEVVGALWHEENQVQLFVVVATGITGDLGPIRQVMMADVALSKKEL